MPSSIGPKIVDENLIFYVDAANEKSYPGSGNTWFDLSGSGNHAELSGTWSHDTGNTAIHLNEGAQLDGTGRANVTFSGTGGQFTIETIFRVNRYKYLASPSNFGAQLFSSGRTVGNFDRAYYLGRNSLPAGEATSAGQAYYLSGRADGPGGGADEIDANTTYYTAVTVDSTDTLDIFFYRNGYQSAVDNITGSGSLNGEWAIANQPMGFDQGLDSNFHLVKVYMKILTPEEIHKNYTAYRGRYNI